MIWSRTFLAGLGLWGLAKCQSIGEGSSTPENSPTTTPNSPTSTCANETVTVTYTYFDCEGEGSVTMITQYDNYTVTVTERDNVTTTAMTTDYVNITETSFVPTTVPTTIISDIFTTYTLNVTDFETATITVTNTSTLLEPTTLTLPGSTVTSVISGDLTTITLPGSTVISVSTIITEVVNVTTITEAGETITSDILVPTTIINDIINISTVTEPSEVVTSDIVVPTTIVLPGSTVTQVISGSSVTITEPGEVVTSDIFVPTTIILPGSTVTQVFSGSLISITEPGVTITSNSPGPPTTITLPGGESTATLPASTITTMISGALTTITVPGSISALIQNQVTQLPAIAVTVADIVTCPMPTNAGPVTPQDTGPNALWGCSPGFVCSPPKPDGCDLFANPPDYDFLCEKQYCIPAPPFTDVVWPIGQISYYPPIEGYFNLNPNAFGLDYAIFVEKIITEYINGNAGSFILTTITTGDWTSQATIRHFPRSASPAPARLVKPRSPPTLVLKRDSSIVPAVCYAQCNNCYLEAQRVGKSPALCTPGSAFESDYASCQACAAANGDSTKATLQAYVEPKFAPFVSFCQAHAALPEVSAAPAALPTPASTSTEVVKPQPQTQGVVVATSTAPEPVVSVLVTSQVPAQTGAAAGGASGDVGGGDAGASSKVFSAETADGVATTRPGTADGEAPTTTATTSSGFAQITGNGAGDVRPRAGMALVLGLVGVLML